MNNFVVIHYSLITREDLGRCFFELKSKKPDGDFSEKLVRSRQPKIYLVRSEDSFLYVGYASQSIKTRLGQGFRANGERGYHGYKWKNLEEVELIVFVFPILDSISKSESRKYFEAIEAELVYKIRTHTGGWPIYQSEIHFNNTSRSEVLEIAEEMFEKLRK